MRSLLLFLTLTTHVLAQDVVSDRYTLVNTAASSEQRFPLIEVKSVNIPKKHTSNAQAIDIILKGTGYAQASLSHRSMADKVLMEKPLPAINRQLVNMTVHEMLQAIAGVGHVVIVDPINRLIAFERDHAFD